MSEPIYILCEPSTYAQSEATGTFVTESLAQEGFIHASPACQLNRVANLYYQSATSLLILKVAIERLKAPLRWEPASTGDLYPHIYGPLNLDAIASIIPVQRNTDGRYDVETVLAQN